MSGSRNLYALAEQGDLPRFFGRVHPRFRTPANAVLVTSGVSLVLALSGTFAVMAAASAITPADRLRRHVRRDAPAPQRRFAGVVRPPTFVVPLGPVVPAAAIVIALAILAGATKLQLTSVAGAFAAGAVLYLIAVRGATTAR